ncbi:hypothetical protein J6590_055573 [Homalodisca vitripennis]|nr:hypothetical protein J6590_055573 [Homalodisca vitripennis]
MRIMITSIYIHYKQTKKGYGHSSCYAAGTANFRNLVPILKPCMNERENSKISGQRTGFCCVKADVTADVHRWLHGAMLRHATLRSSCVTRQPVCVNCYSLTNKGFKRASEQALTQARDSGYVHVATSTRLDLDPITWP